MKKLTVKITVTEELTDGVLWAGKKRIAYASVPSRTSLGYSSADLLRELATKVEQKRLI